MEPDMVVQMISDINEKGVEISELAGDDDTTGFERAKKILPNSKMVKTSDRNHVKKNVVKKLYALKAQHKDLSVMVINSIAKNFSFMIDQNTGNPAGIENGLRALIKHMYGEHDECNISWCGYLKDSKSYQHSNLPHGKDLSSPSLRTALEKLFLNELSSQSEKLSNLSSSQANESLNNTIASKAPKSKHYSSSASLGYRVSSAILQKNDGYTYVSKV